MRSRLVVSTVFAAVLSMAVPSAAGAQASARAAHACVASAPVFRGSASLSYQSGCDPVSAGLARRARSGDGPTMAHAYVTLPLVAVASSIPADPFAAQRGRRRGRKAEGTTLMIVGGAAFVSGILIGGTGGTVLALGGVGVGAYGVYLFVN